MGKLRVFLITRRFIIKSEDDANTLHHRKFLASSQGKIVISKFLKLKNYINLGTNGTCYVPI
jgi:hypothetical protein